MIAAVLVAVVMTWKDKFSGGHVGVSLVMVMTFSSTLMRMMRTWTMMASSVGAITRVRHFVMETGSEEVAASTTEVAQDWPARGKIEFKDLVAAHAPLAEPVMKGLSLTMEPSEHIASCAKFAPDSISSLKIRSSYPVQSI
ncbi:hypothetical protein MY1884_007891 [Beauveria asiatica]